MKAKLVSNTANYSFKTLKTYFNMFFLFLLIKADFLIMECRQTPCVVVPPRRPAEVCVSQTIRTGLHSVSR